MGQYKTQKTQGKISQQLAVKTKLYSETFSFRQNIWWPFLVINSDFSNCLSYFCKNNKNTTLYPLN